MTAGASEWGGPRANSLWPDKGHTPPCLMPSSLKKHDEEQEPGWPGSSPPKRGPSCCLTCQPTLQCPSPSQRSVGMAVNPLPCRHGMAASPPPPSSSEMTSHTIRLAGYQKQQAAAEARQIAPDPRSSALPPGAPNLSS
mmetsp:Transcript_13370/g.37914  ORF Transcript_13370/g.37914 Transcript_13370/m.37914 type:complete len:139 (+) Transcript_13370:2754-3170(+)